MFTKIEVIFVLGGPGAGKGTQCKLIAERYRICHISVGDILRAEIENPDSKWAPLIRANMAEGRVGPARMTVGLLKTTMIQKTKDQDISIFLIDVVLSLDCPFEILQSRVLSRAKVASRIDDGVDIIQKRYNQFILTCKPVIAAYQVRGLVVEIDAARDVSLVNVDIENNLRKYVPMVRKTI
ncbi:uridylate kinase protein [Rutstroemia sp. NJR-2017a BBW]|nr:uridylate kinase protein [Rutstroemia sp. NJR-2017a BBW]